MASSGPTKACPRCNAALPAQAVFCGSCGWQFSAPASSAAASAPAGSPAASAGWPQSQPTVQAAAQPQPPAMPGYPLPGQAGPTGYAPVAAAPAPRPGISKILLAVIVVAAIITVGIPGYLVFGGQGGSGLFADRHGLPSNVPLPSGATFQLKDNVGTGGSLHEWDWTVASPNNSNAVQAFYKSNLPSNGWSNVTDDPQGGGEYLVNGCQTNQVVEVTTTNTTLDVGGGQTAGKTITAPSGGATLQIILSSDPGEIDAFCRG